MSNTVIRWNPFRELAAMQSAMDRMFEETWRESRPAFSSNNLALDIYENDATYTVVANLPGVNADDINVTLHDGVLTIHAEVNRQEQGEGTRALIEERFYGSLTRRVNLPQGVDMDHVEAQFEGGVLALRLPKTAEAQPRQIKINNGDLLKSQN